ncbi:MAG TPA: hypothetical protein VKF40_14600 [Burkholderiales bacterium]|nr:hypothetical protein [Burkholderiales bacterium]
MRWFSEFDVWVDWIRSVDGAWLFLLILAFVIAVVGFWSRSLRMNAGRHSEKERLRS